MHRLPAPGGTGLTELVPDDPRASAGDEERRDGLAAVSVAERSLSAEGAQWLSLALVAVAAVLAHQVTKHIVSSQLALDDELEIVGPFSIHHVQNSGIAFGLFSNATAAVIAITSVAVVWMLVFFARAGARHPVLPVALGLVVGGILRRPSGRLRELRPVAKVLSVAMFIGVAVVLSGTLQGFIDR